MKSLVWAMYVGACFAAVYAQPVRVGVIEVVVNADRVRPLTVYRSSAGERYVQLRDLAAILGGTVTFNAAAKYAAMSVEDHTVYFCPGADYVIAAADRINLQAPIISSGGRIYVPEALLTMSAFLSPLCIETNVTTERNVLFVSYTDNLHLNYFVVQDAAEVHVEMRRPMHHEFSVERGVVTLTFYGGRLSPKEYTIVDGILSRMTVRRVGASTIVTLYPSIAAVDIRRSTAPGSVTVTVMRLSTSVPVAGDAARATGEQRGAGGGPAVPPQHRKVIVLDPGHGGQDPGAVGPGGTLEKHVTLAIAKKVRSLLVSAGFTVYLTREDDTFMPLVERTAFANAKRADLFVSIHCNAAGKTRSGEKGFEAYSLSEYATDPDAVATERLENEAIRFEQPTGAQEKLQKLLWSLVLNEYMNESSRLNGLIAREVVKRTGLNHRGVKQAGFYVLRGAQMPAVLLECGFISNPVEEARLVKPEFQMSIADGIASGIRQYYDSCHGR